MATIKKVHQLFEEKKCTPEKILATPMISDQQIFIVDIFTTCQD